MYNVVYFSKRKGIQVNPLHPPSSTLLSIKIQSYFPYESFLFWAPCKMFLKLLYDRILHSIILIRCSNRYVWHSNFVNNLLVDFLYLKLLRNQLIEIYGCLARLALCGKFWLRATKKQLVWLK